MKTRQPTAAACVAVCLAWTPLLVAVSALAHSVALADPTSSAGGRVFLPAVSRHGVQSLPSPDPDLAERVFAAASSLEAARPLADLFPGYASGQPPSVELAEANVDAACHDFPDLPDVYGAGVHRETCYFAVASYLGDFHAVAARQRTGASDLAWAQAYLQVAAKEAATFTYGPEAPGGGYRDSLAAAWQNPLRAVDLVILGEQVRQAGALDPETRDAVADEVGGIARAWRAAFWETGVHPSHGVTLTIRTPPAVSAVSPLLSRDVACRVPWSIAWDADRRNSPAEEVAWMGAGVVLASRALGPVLDDGGELAAAGRHYLDYALTYDRPDPLHGAVIRTLSRGDPGGAYGARRYWLKNHAEDAPAIPYVAATWHFIGTALMGTPGGHEQPWPGLVPDDAQWQVMLRGTEESLLAPDGQELVDWSVGGGIGYALEDFPLWRTQCGQAADGVSYTRFIDTATGQVVDLSEIGHPAGLDLLDAGWVIRQIAAGRGDAATYRLWTERLERIVDEYTSRPPDPEWARCKFAPYVSSNPAYHTARFLGEFAVAYLGLSGFQVQPWFE